MISESFGSTTRGNPLGFRSEKANVSESVACKSVAPFPLQESVNEYRIIESEILHPGAIKDRLESDNRD